MKMISVKETTNSQLHNKLYNFGAECKKHMTFIENHITCTPTIDLQIHINKLTSYITQNQTLVLEFIDKFEQIYEFINSLEHTLQTIYGDLIIDYWNYKDDEIHMIKSSQWEYAFIISDRCSLILSDIEKFEMGPLKEFKKQINHIQKNKKHILNVLCKHHITEDMSNIIANFTFQHQKDLIDI